MMTYIKKEEKFSLFAHITAAGLLITALLMLKGML